MIFFYYNLIILNMLLKNGFINDELGEAIDPYL